VSGNAPPFNRRRFLKHATLLPACAFAGWTFPASDATAAKPVPRVGGAKLKTSLNAYSFKDALNRQLRGEGGGMSLFDLLDFCAKHNFDAVDPTGYFFPGYPEAPPDAFVHEFKRRAFQLGLDISGTGVKNDFAEPDKQKRAADLQRVRTWVAVAAKLGAPVLRVFAGPVPAGYENKWDEVARWMAEDLRTCAEYGQAHGVLVGVQNHGDMLKTAEQAIQIVKLVDSDWFGVVVDTGFFLTADPYADIRQVIPYAVNWQVKESPFGKASPIRTDLKRLIRIIREGGYRGYLPIETLAAPGRPYDPHARVPAFLAELREALGQAS
jgi:sugar phosphate isomerase/epimerase